MGKTYATAARGRIDAQVRVRCAVRSSLNLFAPLPMQPPEENQGTGTSQTFPNVNMDDLTSRTEEFARQEPVRAVGIAFVVGLVLTLLPIGAIIGGLLRLALSLVKPALLILGATKVYDELQKRQ